MSRRVWFARDCWFTSDERVEALGAKYGAEGPMLLEEVYALAKLADRKGHVSALYSVLARRAFVKSPRRAREILGTAVGSGLLELLSDDGEAFEVQVPRWSRWQVVDPTAAERQARSREQKRAEAVT